MIIIDKFENDIVVVRDTTNKTTFNLPTTLVSIRAKKGDALIFDNQFGYYVVNNQKVAEMKQ